MYSKFGQPPLKLPHTWGDTHWAGLGWPHSGAAIVEWSLVGHFVANLQQNETFSGVWSCQVPIYYYFSILWCGHHGKTINSWFYAPLNRKNEIVTHIREWENDNIDTCHFDPQKNKKKVLFNKWTSYWLLVNITKKCIKIIMLSQFLVMLLDFIFLSMNIFTYQ